MTSLDRHLDEQSLLLFHYHQLEPEAYQRLATHLEECVACRLELDRLEQVLAQSPPPNLAFAATDQSAFWARMRRRRRLRRLRRGVTALALLSVAGVLLAERYPEWPLWTRLQSLAVPAALVASEVPPAATEPFDLPLTDGWLQRYLPAAEEAPAVEIDPTH